MRRTPGTLASTIAVTLLVGFTLTAAAAESPTAPESVVAESPAPPPPTATGPEAAQPQESTSSAPKAPATGDAPPAQRLGEIVVTASRTEEKGFDSPYAITTVTADAIRDHFYRTPTDALRDIPGIMPQKTSLGQGSPFIRGFTGYHVLHMVDGIRLNNSTFRSGPNQYWNTIDALSIDHIEAVKGPGGVLYGSDAVGGILNAITKGPQGYGEGFRTGGRLSYQLSSAGHSQVGRGEVWATWDHTLGLYLGGSAKDFGNLRGGHSVGIQHNTGYEEWDGDFKAEYFLNPNTRLVFGHQHVRQTDVPRTHRTVDGVQWEGLVPGTELRHDLTQERDLTFVQLHAEKIDSWVDALHVSLSWHEQTEELRRLRTGNRFNREGAEIGTVGASVQLESNSPIGRLVYGVDHYHDTVNSFSSANAVQGPVADNSDYGLTGLFLQDTIPVGESFDLTLGGRYEHARAKADSVFNATTGQAFAIRNHWDSVVGSARGVYHVDKAGHWNLFGGVSQAFRAPNLSDLTRFDIARSGELETPVADLDPEHFLCYEIGAKSEYQNFAIQASYFYTVIEDLIVRQPTGAIIGGNREVTKRNAGTGFIQGVELAPRWRFMPEWTAFGTFTWQEGRLEDFPTAAAVKSRQHVSRLMPTTTQVGVRWDDPKGRLWAEVTGTFAARQDHLTADDRRDNTSIAPNGTPGYGVLSMRTGYQVTKNVDLTFAIENVTNEDYRIHGARINEPGRNFLFGVEMKF